MSKLEVMRNRLDKKLFNVNQIGSNITITPITRSEGSFGGYSGDTVSEGTVVDTVAVPYNSVSSRLSYQPKGDLKEGDVEIVFRYDEDIDIDYRVSIGSNDYKIKEIRNILLNKDDSNSGIVAYIATCTKDHS